jgi:peptidoglycan/LPS O-acetylase OafA/YrhL
MTELAIPRSMIGPAASTVEKTSVPSVMDKRHVPSLDGVRGLAVLLVLFAHTGAPGGHLGVLGVDIFFVLSGFLITTLLATEKEQRGRISLPKFWARRALRLMPAYWLFLGAMTILMVFGGPMEAHHGWSPRWHIASLWLYFSNYLPLGGFSPYNTMTYHIWTLSLEEQFYFIWPLICALSLKLKRPYVVPWIMAAAMLLWRIHLPLDMHTVGVRTETRGIGMVFGCSVALTLFAARRSRVELICGHPIVRRLVAATVIAAVGVDAALLWSGRIDLIVMFKWMVPPLTFLFSILVGMLWYGGEDRITRLLSWKPLVYIGTISYGIYLYQTVPHELTWNVILAGIGHWEKHIKFVIRSVFFAASSIGVAALSYHFYEKRFLVLKARFK